MHDVQRHHGDHCVARILAATLMTWIGCGLVINMDKHFMCVCWAGGAADT